MKTIILSDEQYASLQAALSYAAEQRFYEANQTVDGLDRVQIEACAHDWSRLQDALQNSIESAEDIKVKIFMWRGIIDAVLANTAAIDAETIHADNDCDDLSDEDAAKTYKEKLKSEGFVKIPYEEGCYKDSNEGEDEEL